MSTLSVASMSEPIQTFNQLGGKGLITNKALAIPVHLGDPWNSLEYVVLSPSVDRRFTEIGEHTQATDEIYYVLGGKGLLQTNGEPKTIGPGFLAIAPRGTRHSLRNLSTEDSFAMLVVELKVPHENSPAHQPACIENVPALLNASQPFHTSSKPLRVAAIPLSNYFAAPWGMLRLVEIPPGGQVEEYVVETCDENLFLVSGSAIIVAGDHAFQSGEKGLNIVVPAGMPRRIRNHSSQDLLIVLSLEVRRTGTMATANL